MEAKPKTEAGALVAGDWALHTCRVGYNAPPAEWSLDRIVFATPEYALVTYTHRWRSYASQRLQIIPRHDIHAFGSKALVARFRAACVRRFRPYETEVENARAVINDAALKASNAVQKMRAKSRLAPAKAH